MLNCPSCQASIPLENVNIQADIGKCDSCGNVFKVSQLVNGAAQYSGNFNIDNPPKGVHIHRAENRILIRASTASPMALFMIPFMLVWSGFSLGGIYGSQIISGKFNILTSLFGIPFILGTLFFGARTLMMVIGKIVIDLTPQGGTVFTGIGPFGFKKRFSWGEIELIKEEIGSKRSLTGSIAIEGQRRISFGAMLSSSKKYYVMRALQDIAVQMKKRSL